MQVTKGPEYICRRADRDTLYNSISRLDAWVTRNEWAGYDPYDIKGTSLLLYLQRPGKTRIRRGFNKLIRVLLFHVEARFPLLVRKIFFVSPSINAKAMGLFARGYLNLYQTTGNPSYKEKALQCLDWLMKNSSSGYSGRCWGYPFDWQTIRLIPAGTPSAVVSSVVGDAFWTAWVVLGSQTYLDCCVSICRFFVTDLNRDEFESGAMCFSYTPLDDFHVHNANLFVAEYLVRVGNAVGNVAWGEMGLKAARYALSEQNLDGSLFYWGKAQNQYNKDHLDHYHTGFEIRALHGIWKTTGLEEFGRAYKRYYAFYLANFIEKRGAYRAPKATPTEFYPVNIHSCAEAILLNASLAKHEEEALKLVFPLLRWTVGEMQTDDGWFVYMLRKTPRGEVAVRVPYIRWGQAWMLLAMSECLCLEYYLAK